MNNNSTDYDDEIDYSDIEAKYHVPYEDGFDAVIVIDNLPVVDAGRKDKLLQVFNKHLKKCNAPKPDNVFMPWDDAKNSSKGYAFVDFSTADEANIAIAAIHGTHFDKSHALFANRFTDIEKFASLDEEYVEPEVEPYQPKEHLRSWLADPQGRDQFVSYKDDKVSIYWHHKPDSAELVEERQNWTDLYVQWSPFGTYLVSIHRQGVQLWGGASWSRICRFVHPGVKLVAFSPNENYIVTWSPEPMAVVENPPPNVNIQFTEEDEGNQIAVWDAKTGRLLRSFPALPPAKGEEDNAEKRKQVVWPALKWSGDDKYVGRLAPGEAISVYELPSMRLADKKSIKIEGIVDFEWCPIGDKDREAEEKEAAKKGAKKERENMLAYWTPEVQNQPARVTLMSFPSRTVLRSKNLFNVSDCKIHWQNAGDFLCVKVDRHTKTKKSIFCNLELFRVREKDYPVEVIELKDQVLEFSWEPLGERFAIIHSSDPNLMAGPAPGITIKTEVSFYGHDKTKGDFRLIKQFPNKTTNTIRWSPRGRHVVLTTMGNSNHFGLEFYDLDFTMDDRKEGVESVIQLMSPPNAEHYGITDLEWDTAGRFVATSASAWRHTIENGYAIWDFRGNEQEKHIIDKFKQFLWRPRPRTLLPKQRQKEIRKNLKEYSRAFDEEDEQGKTAADQELVAHRKRLVDEWNAWRLKVRKQREEAGLLDEEEEEEPAR
ncbi:translation initiation factor eIF-3b [Clavulina sp. PMI_390]|nr:translation initiation factor eIF-3b [Clavulina sp. PMI_390]